MSADNGWKRRARWLAIVAVACVAGRVCIACTPSIGDKCVLSTDCSLQGDRLCDTSEPNGYCTVFNCQADKCPNEAACVLFGGSVPGCGYNDRTPARSGRPFCVQQCHTDSDCRVEDGYVCRDPRLPPWSGIILDDDQTQLTCLVLPELDAASASVSEAPVCSVSSPGSSPIDAAPPSIKRPDASVVDSSAPDTGPDASDAGLDAADAGD